MTTQNAAISSSPASSVAASESTSAISPSSSVASSSSSAPSECPSGMVYDVFQTGPNAPKRYQQQTYPPDFLGKFDPSVYDGDAGDYLFSGAGEDINWNSHKDPNQPPDSGTPYAFLPGKAYHINTANVVVVYHGYFKPSVDGNYGLKLDQSTDNVAYIWTGDKAYSGWTSGNYDAFTELWVDYTHSTYSFPAQAGNLLPVTILIVNQGEPGVLQVNVIDHDGTEKTDTSGFFVQPACQSDGSRFNSPPKGVTPTQGPPGQAWQ